jgi:broad specificity phosphatase PhoE
MSTDPKMLRPILLIALRHGEKERGTSDPGLTRAGHRRAEALAALLGRTVLAAIFTSDYRRCQESVEPLVRECGVEATVIEAADPHRQLAAIRALPPGSAAVLCGHANTIPALLRALGAELPELDFGMIPEGCHDRLYLASFLPAPESAPAATSVHVLRYGEPT